jgi:DNA processing protein
MDYRNNAKEAERALACAVYCVDGIGSASLIPMYEYAGSMKNLLKLLAGKDAGLEELIHGKSAPYLRKVGAEYAKGEASFLERAGNLYEKYLRAGIHFTFIGEDEYPGRLRDIPTKPFGLFYKGKLPDEDRPAVSVIGARECSEYGRRCAELFGKTLAGYGVQIISGMARGIDGTSQRAALEGGGDTYGVLGSGVDVIYPKENALLYQEVIVNGGVISEYRPGTGAKSTLFPARNRIISGLCDVLLVVEARHRSGTYITVCQALEQGRDIYAVPGRITDGLSDGCNQLIKDGAGIASDPGVILDALSARFRIQSLSALPEDSKVEKKEAAKTVPSALMRALEETPQSIEMIQKRLANLGLDISYTELLCELTDLCLLGKAEGIGNYYRLI